MAQQARNALSSPFLPEHVQAIAMFTRPRDVAAMARVQHDWAAILADPVFARRVLAEHPAWSPTMRLFIKAHADQLLALAAPHWTMWLPLLDEISTATAGTEMWNITNVRPVSQIVQWWIFWSLTWITATCPNPHDDDDDEDNAMCTAHWTLLHTTLRWAWRRGDTAFMHNLWAAVIDTNKGYTAWTMSRGRDARGAFKGALLDELFRSHRFTEAHALFSEAEWFWCDAGDIVQYVIDHPACGRNVHDWSPFFSDGYTALEDCQMADPAGMLIELVKAAREEPSLRSLVNLLTQ